MHDRAQQNVKGGNVTWLNSVSGAGCFRMKVSGRRCGDVHSYTREALPACSLRVSCTCTVCPVPADSGASSLQLLSVLALLVLALVGLCPVVELTLTGVPLPLQLAFMSLDRRRLRSAMTMLNGRGCGSCSPNTSSRQIEMQSMRQHETASCPAAP